MQSRSDLHHVVAAYLHLIRLDSAEAAAAIEELFALCGADAALRASLVVTLLKMEIQANFAVETMTIQLNLIDRYPEALPLLERAITCYMRDWGMPNLWPLGLANDQHTTAVEEPVIVVWPPAGQEGG